MGLPQLLVTLAACVAFLASVLFVVVVILCSSFFTQGTCCAKLFARLPSVLVLATLAGEAYVFNMLSAPGLGWCLLFDLLLILAGWSFWRAAFTDAGTPASSEWAYWEVQGLRGSVDLLPPQEPRTRTGTWSDSDAAWCNKCSRMRPERAHHCSHCNTCVLRMDHHCPMLGNCIGFRNHKYFMLSHVWSVVACGVFLFVPKGPGIDMVRSRDLIGSHANPGDVMALRVAVFWAGVLFFLTGTSVGVVVRHAMRNQTAIEAEYHGNNPYSLGVSENLRQLVGELNFRVLLPLEPTGRECLGTAFPKGRGGGGAGGGKENEHADYGSLA